MRERKRERESTFFGERTETLLGRRWNGRQRQTDETNLSGLIGGSGEWKRESRGLIKVSPNLFNGTAKKTNKTETKDIRWTRGQKDIVIQHRLSLWRVLERRRKKVGFLLT